MLSNLLLRIKLFYIAIRGGVSMYCDGTCKYLNKTKHKCKLTGEKLSYIKQKGSVSFSVHEHDGFCVGDDNGRKAI